MDPYPGTITVEYYDGSSDFSESDDSEHPSPKEHSSSPCSSSSSTSQNISDSVTCKTYDFKHIGSESEYNDHTVEREAIKGKIFSDTAREAMNSHYFITHQECTQSLTHPKASFPRCPRGDVPEQYSRRKHPGPFLTCSFSHCHECGDDFVKVLVPTKPTPAFDTFTRPRHLKERKAKFFKQCKHCETIAFTHHRNPASHYEDYLNTVTYKQHNDHAKVWQQHVVDLMFMLGENSETSWTETNIIEKCKHYKPSDVIVNGRSRYQRNTQRRIPTVIAKKRTAIVRPMRRPLHKTNVSSKVSSLTNSTRVQPNVLEQEQISEVAEKHSSNQEDSTARNARNRRKSNELHLHSTGRSSSSGINTNGRASNALDLNQRQKTSVTRLINSQQASLKTKSFVKEPAEPPKEVKYIQRGRPNISVKFLRARSRNKHTDMSNSRLDPTGSTSSRSKGNSSFILKNIKQAQAQNQRAFGKSHRKSNSKDDSNSSDDGSYAKYRDKNGEFDVEKYRQSILKMLAENSGNGVAQKKKKLKRVSQSSHSNFVTLPKVKNSYRNVKPRIASNFTQRKRRKVRKPKRDSEFDLQFPSDISLKSKYWNEDSIGSKDSYFSIPSVKDLHISS